MTLEYELSKMKCVSWVEMISYVVVKDKEGKKIFKREKLGKLRFVSHSKSLKP